MMPNAQEEETDSLQASLEKAYDEAEAADSPAGADEPAPEPNKAEPSEPTAAERARDEKGRFAPKGKDAEPEEPKAAKTAEVKPAAPAPATGKPAAEPPPAAPSTPALRPPQAWRPAAREKWGSLPPDLQQEIVRTSQAAQARIAQAAQSEKFAQAFQQAIAPYNHIIAADGGDPFRTTAGMLQAYATLRHGSVADKAGLVAKLVRDHGVDINALAAAIDGAPAPQQTQQQFQDPRFDQFMAQLQAAQAQQQQATRAAAHAELEKFAETHEFLDDVREDMYLIMARAEERGVDCTLEDAYNRAVKLNPDTAAAMEQREAAKAATGNGTPSTQRVKAATSSVRGQPAGPPPSGTKTRTLDEELNAVADSMGW